jgi:hypothetical protein
MKEINKITLKKKNKKYKLIIKLNKIIKSPPSQQINNKTVRLII